MITFKPTNYSTTELLVLYAKIDNFLSSLTCNGSCEKAGVHDGNCVIYTLCYDLNHLEEYVLTLLKERNIPFEEIIHITKNLLTNK